MHPDNLNPFYTKLACHIESAGAEAGYSVILCSSDRDPVKETSVSKVRVWQWAVRQGRRLSAGAGRGRLACTPAMGLDGDWSYESGRQAIHTLFDEIAQDDDIPEAVFVCNDAMAIGALASLAEIGLSVPDDLSVIGFDGVALSRYTVPPLTTIRTPIAGAGRTMWRLLLDRIAGTLPDDAQWLPLDCELVVRGTTATRG